MSGNGYGRLKCDRKGVLAHRIAWRLHYGPIPQGMCVCHSCDNPICVNPSHLFLGTQAENTADRHRKGRTRVPRGEAHGASKLCDSQVIAIRRDHRVYREIAADYGVTKMAISKIKRRQNWAHLPEVA